MAAHLSSFFISLLSLVLIVLCEPIHPRASSALSVCNQIGQQISDASDIVYALNILEFSSDIHHWFDSSTEIPACVLEVGSAEDTAIALKLIAQNKTPFAVYSGGHASNPRFSSTKGVHFSLTRMKQVIFSSDKSTVEIGMGWTWAGVYKALESSGMNVVGGRVPGPGVGGLTLGGGYSWKTNQFGLTADTVQSFNLVLPNGTLTTVDSSTPDLFFALKGGLNRFGIVTSAVYTTHPQSPVYGGIAIYTSSQIPAVISATQKFYDSNKDPKAQIITTLEGFVDNVTAIVLFFYDGPNKPASFDFFDDAKSLISTVKTQSFASFVNGIPSELELNSRGAFNSLSTSKLTPAFLAAVQNETLYWSTQMFKHGGTSASYDLEPFIAGWGQHATDSAYPHADSPLPLNIYFAWVSEDQDTFWLNAMKQSTERLRQVAVSEGILPSDFTVYPNYALADTSSTQLYGAANAARLRTIKSQVDPNGIMELAGGFQL